MTYELIQVNTMGELDGKYILRCENCDALMVADSKPKGFHVGDVKCSECGGRLKEAEVRTCHTCGDKKPAYKHGIMLDDINCESCGDPTGFCRDKNMVINVISIGRR